MPFVNNKGVQIYYEIECKDPCIAYVHGSGMNQTILSRQRAYFQKKGFGSLAIDSRGHGRSGLSKDPAFYTLDAFTSDLEAVLDAESVREVILVGLSAGGLVSQNYAARHPERVSRLVLISSSTHFRDGFCKDAFRSFLYRLHPVVKHGWTAYNRVTPKNGRYYPDYGDGRFSEMSQFDFLREFYRNSSREFIQAELTRSRMQQLWDTRGLAEKIESPTLVISGRDDFLVPKESAYDLKRRISRAEVVLLPGGHDLIFRNAERINYVIDEFLEAVHNTWNCSL